MKKITWALYSALAFSLTIPDMYAQTQRSDTAKYPPKTNYNNAPGGTGSDTMHHKNKSNRSNNRSNNNRKMNTNRSNPNNNMNNGQTTDTAGMYKK